MLFLHLTHLRCSLPNVPTEPVFAELTTLVIWLDFMSYMPDGPDGNLTVGSNGEALSHVLEALRCGRVPSLSRLHFIFDIRDIWYLSPPDSNGPRHMVELTDLCRRRGIALRLDQDVDPEPQYTVKDL